MCKLAHVIRYTVLSQNFIFFAVLERWLIYDCETECSFVCLIYIDRILPAYVTRNVILLGLTTATSTVELNSAFS